jgi:NADPH-dependent glutamate synthase beta subunit-like oxidoreductase
LNPATHFKQMRRGLDLPQAIAEADRCLLCHDAPCSQGCPADTRPAEFIRKLRFRNITGAIRTVKANNILGGACGELCPTHRLCEKACSARFAAQVRPEGADRPIAIGKIQRFLVEHAWQIGFKPLRRGAARGAKVAVVGSGPAGLSCAAELAQEGYPVTVFESRPEPGGVLRYGVVAYRFSLDFLKKELEDVADLGVEFACSHPIEGPAAAEELLKQGFGAVFLAPGLWAAETIDPQAASLIGVYSSVDYLSALRDGRFKEMAERIAGKTVAVIGGGSVAMDCVESAARLGAADVYLVYRRSYAQMPAEPDERMEAQAAGVHFLLLNQPKGYVTGRGRRLKGLKLVRTRLGAPDASGRRSPRPVKGSEWVLDCDVAIEAIGNRPDAGAPDWYPRVKRTGDDLIKVNPKTGRTSVKGIFAGGDIVRGPALVVQAVADGKTAARAIHRYLSEQEGRAR